MTYGDAPFPLNITDTNMEEAVQYEVTSGADTVEVSGDGTVTIKTAKTENVTIKVTLPASTNYNAAQEQIITITVAKKTYGTDGKIAVNKKYLYSRINEDTIDLSSLLPTDCGAVIYSVSDKGGTYDTDPAFDANGNLKYTVSSGNINDTGKIVAKAETDNYKEIIITVNWERTDKYPVILKTGTSVTLKNNVLTYGESLSKLTFNTAVFVSQDEPTKQITGTLAWTNPDTKPKAGTSSAEWAFTPYDSAYASVTENANITVKKATPNIVTVPTVDMTYNPNITLSGIDLNMADANSTTGITVTAGSVTDVDGNELPGTWSWNTSSQVPLVNNNGYEATFTPKDTVNYETVTRTITVKVAKATPDIRTQPTASEITYGQKLEKSILTGGVAYSSTKDNAITIGGVFTWENISIKPTVADSKENNATQYIVVFTPTDKVNYETVKTMITLTVQKSADTPDMPGSTLSVPYSCKKVSDYTLAGDWTWNTQDAGKELEVGIQLEAEAVYNGADKGNYETESRIVTISRSACEHVAGEILYTGIGDHAPDCENTGLGHRECTKCHEVTESGIVVAALGHQGGTATCRSKAVCSVCQQEYGTTNPDNHAATEVRGHKNADCTTAGYTGDTHCADCGMKLKGGTTIPALGHHYVSRTTKEATVTAEGIMTYTCDRCGHSYTRPIARLESNKPDNNKLDSNKPGDNNKPADNSKPDTGKPYIEGNTTQNGWENIKDQLEKAKDKNTVTVEMNGTTVVPGDIFDTIKGKDVNVVFDLGDGITWTVNGKDITEEKIGDIDFGVTVGSQAGKNLPVEIINKVTGERYSLNLTLSYEGEFGFTATLTLNVDKENAGLFANLFYYNPETGELEYICADKIDEEGNANLKFTHASDYVVVIDAEDMQTAQDTETTGNGENMMEEISADSRPQETAPADSRNTAVSTVILITAVMVLLAGSVWYAVRKKRK